MHHNNYNTNSIILLGYMGSGKSTVGRELARFLDRPFYDLDDLIAQEHHTTIPKLFEEKGVKAFRQIEHDILLRTLRSDTSCVLSLGGGTPCYHDNMKHIVASTPHVFYLDASPSALTSRLFAQKDGRPLIAHLPNENALKEFIAKHLFERRSFYNQAHHKIAVGEKSVDQLVSSIAALL